MDNCIRYSKNFSPSEFVFDFFEKTEITKYEMYEIDKIRQLRYEFPNFWLSLDNDNKIKFINIVTNNSQKIYPVVKFPTNFVL
jgi:hypothetical protein